MKIRRVPAWRAKSRATARRRKQRKGKEQLPHLHPNEIPKIPTKRLLLRRLVHAQHCKNTRNERDNVS